jgi:hypothetical protein
MSFSKQKTIVAMKAARAGRVTRSKTGSTEVPFGDRAVITARIPAWFAKLAKAQVHVFPRVRQGGCY